MADYDIDEDNLLNHSEMNTLLKSCQQYIAPNTEEKQEIEEHLNEQGSTILKGEDSPNIKGMNLAKFMSWASDNFNVLEFFEIFELIPLLE